MATEAQLAALARGRAKRSGSGQVAVDAQQPGGWPWWAYALVVVVVLVVVLVVAVVLVDRDAQKGAAEKDLVPLRPNMFGPGRKVLVLHPRKSFVRRNVRDKFESAVAATSASDPPVRVLDASAPGGGKLPPHVSHVSGHDIDIDSTKLSTTEAQSLVDALLNNGANIVASTRPDLTRVTPWEGHQDHFHVRYS